MEGFELESDTLWFRFSNGHSGCFVENRLWAGRRQKQGVSSEAILVLWVRDVGCAGEHGVERRGEMQSHRGHILKLEPTETAN